MCLGLAMLRLRKIEPALVRPYRVPHQLIAVAFTGVSGVLAGVSLCADAEAKEFCVDYYDYAEVNDSWRQRQ